MKPSVYLAGPITGLSWEECTAWRRRAVEFFACYGIDAFSPLRGKEYLSKEESMAGHYSQPLSTPKAVVMRDRLDCTKRDLLLVNLLYAKWVSIGTVFEIAWANQARVPIVLAMEPGNPHDNIFINECSGVRVTDFDQAMELALHVLLPSGGFLK